MEGCGGKVCPAIKLQRLWNLLHCKRSLHRVWKRGAVDDQRPEPTGMLGLALIVVLGIRVTLASPLVLAIQEFVARFSLLLVLGNCYQVRYFSLIVIGLAESS